MKTASLGMYSVDPTALDTFHAFDPESFTTLLAIADALIAIGPEGEVVPSLATSWERTSPLQLEMTLRQGVRFHNGEPFDAQSVVETFHHHQHPTPSACGGGILSSLVDVEALGPHRIRITTAFPDAMLLRRLFFFAIYPAGLLRSEGRQAIREHPVGTGAWRFVHWKRGYEILLERNPDHWRSASTVEQIRIPIVRQKGWVDHLASGKLDVVLNIDAHDVVRARRLEGIEVQSRESALSQWFLLASHGPLADVRVRRALNHAIKRSLIAEVSQHGLASPQHSVATRESWGFASDVRRYSYSPELARRLLTEAGYPDGFTLRGLVSETSTGVYFAVREFLERVGVHLEAEIVPRSHWIGRVVGGNLTGNPYQGDFAVSNVDNPLLDSLFHQFIFLFGQGLFSLTRDEAYDQRFLQVATSPDEDGHARRQLEHYAVDQALLLFTVQQQVHAAWREGSEVCLPRSGHFDSWFWWTLDVPDSTPNALQVPESIGDAQALLEASSHTGTFFLPPGHSFQQPWAEHLWNVLQTTEQRWRLSYEPMIRELVTQLEARNQLTSILSSTRRVAIAGYTLEDQQRFANAGFTRMFGESLGHLSTVIESPAWETIAAQVDEGGAWLGPVWLETSGLPEGTPARLHLTATRSLDDEGAPSGITVVLSDFSGEEERIRNQAIRVILDNVPYGLFVVGPDARLHPGVSEACRTLFPDVEIEGSLLGELIGMEPREASGLHMSIEQVFDGWLPDEVTLAQIPARVEGRGRNLSLSASIVRNHQGETDGLLFTCADISELIEAEREIEEMRGSLQVLRFRDRFEGYVHDLDAQLADLTTRHGTPGWEELARRLVHTAKGVFGQFGLASLQRRLHTIEDAPVLQLQHLREVREALATTLEQHVELWGITLEETEPQFELSETSLVELEDSASAARSLEELRSLVRSFTARVRCKPASLVLGPIEDAIVQLAERKGKQVRTRLEGLDHRLPPRLGPVLDVLIHLVRNAVDHGVEEPLERGDKDPCATVSIHIEDEPSGWRITIEDDGRGIDPERLARKALELGVLEPEQLAQLSEAQRLDLLFADGLSTAAEVSDTSGRGVGMAAVRAAVESAGGSIQLHSTLGVGTRFELHLPDQVREAQVA